ncbi:MAG: hypothetical protein ABIH67_04020 [Candidatus Uhrbacteria bacterium]
MSEAVSNTKEFFLDMLYMFGVFLASGYSIPPQFVCDRYAYKRYCERWERNERYRILRDLKQQKLLRIQRKGDKVILELTQKGRAEALKQRMIKDKNVLPENIFCLVSFDIPEYTRKSRDVLRNFLKNIGFKQLHQSAWYSNIDLVEPMCELIKELKIEKWVVVFRAKLASLNSFDASFDTAVLKDASV